MGPHGNLDSSASVGPVHNRAAPCDQRTISYESKVKSSRIEVCNGAGTLGTLTIGVDGSYSFTVAENAAVRSFGAGQTATNIFVYTPSAGSVAGAAQTFTVTVTGSNDAPVAVADTAAVTGAAIVTGSVLANDSDTDAGTTLSVSAVAVPNGAGAVGASITGAFGTLTLEADGQYV